MSKPPINLHDPKAHFGEDHEERRRMAIMVEICNRTDDPKQHLELVHSAFYPADNALLELRMRQVFDVVRSHPELPSLALVIIGECLRHIGRLEVSKGLTPEQRLLLAPIYRAAEATGEEWADKIEDLAEGMSRNG